MKDRQQRAVDGALSDQAWATSDIPQENVLSIMFVFYIIDP